MDGLNVYYFDNLRWLFPNSQRSQPLPYVMPIQMRKSIDSFDIIHIHDHRTFMEVICSYYANKRRKPYIIQPHGSLPYNIGQGALKRDFDAGIGSWILRKAGRLIAVSKSEIQQIKALGVETGKISMVPNGISDEFLVRLSSYEFRNKFNISSDKRIIIKRS